MVSFVDHNDALRWADSSIDYNELGALRGRPDKRGRSESDAGRDASEGGSAGSSVGAGNANSATLRGGPLPAHDHRINLPALAQLRTQVVASTTATALSSLLLSPLSIIKVRLQCESTTSSSSGGASPTILRTTAAVYRAEGLRAFWRGLSTSMGMAIPSTALYMVSYEASRDELMRAAPQSLHMYVPAVAAFGSRTVAAAAVMPLEVVRTRQMKGSTLNLLQEARAIVSTSGVRGLYTGIGMTLARDAPFSAFYWGVLEGTRKLLLRHDPGGMWTEAVPPALAALARERERERGSGAEGPMRRVAPQGMLAASSMAALAACVLTHPFDLVKTRMQTSNALLGSSSAAAARTILQQEGMGIFFRGLGIRLMYLLPGTTLTVTMYDWLKAKLLEVEATRRL